VDLRECGDGGQLLDPLAVEVAVGVTGVDLVHALGGRLAEGIVDVGFLGARGAEHDSKMKNLTIIEHLSFAVPASKIREIVHSKEFAGRVGSREFVIDADGKKALANLLAKYAELK